MIERDREFRMGYDSKTTDYDESVQNQHERAISELCLALLHTRDYVGANSLPAVPGWSWYDAIKKYRPDLLAEENSPRHLQDDDLIVSVTVNNLGDGNAYREFNVGDRIENSPVALRKNMLLFASQLEDYIFGSQL